VADLHEELQFCCQEDFGGLLQEQQRDAVDLFGPAKAADRQMIGKLLERFLGPTRAHPSQYLSVFAVGHLAPPANNTRYPSPSILSFAGQ
jgi:hypothetical protein